MPIVGKREYAGGVKAIWFWFSSPLALESFPFYLFRGSGCVIFVLVTQKGSVGKKRFYLKGHEACLGSPIGIKIEQVADFFCFEPHSTWASNLGQYLDIVEFANYSLYPQPMDDISCIQVNDY